ncbi:MAG: TnsA endonuclease N-terminal domain-containing protein [Rhodospirillales bacterium]
MQYPAPRKPVRTIPLKSRSVRGFYTSTRWPRPIAHESNLERDFLILCDFDTSVRQLTEQPCKITYPSEEGKDRNYTPDFFLDVAAEVGPSQLVEIKFQSELDERADDYAERFSAAREYAEARGWEFKVRTERSIRGDLLANAKFLLPYRRLPIDHGLSARWMRTLASTGPCTVEAALHDAWHNDDEERLRALTELWRLVAMDSISVDLEANRVGLQSLVWPNDR